jgi:hypothetical protein
MERLSGPMTDHCAWRGAELQREAGWRLTIDDDASAALLAGLDQVRDSAIERIPAAAFRAPSLVELATRVAKELEHGRGIVLLHGFPIDGLSLDEIRRVYWGFGLLLGRPVSQNKHGNLICHVRNEGARYGTQNARGYNSNAELRVHNDNADVAGLLCLNEAREGGDSIVTSVATIYNEFLNRRPDLVDQLYEGFRFHLRGEQRAAIWPVTPHRIPTISVSDGKLSCRYVRNAIQLVEQYTGEKLTQRETETLDLFDELALDPELRLDFRMARGDLQLLNNNVTVHARTAFVDHDEPARQRHLLRLWLRVHEGRRWAENFGNRYGADVIGEGVPPVGAPIPFPD